LQVVEELDQAQRKGKEHNDEQQPDAVHEKTSLANISNYRVTRIKKASNDADEISRTYQECASHSAEAHNRPAEAFGFFREFSRELLQLPPVAWCCPSCLARLGGWNAAA
jgi:hypothetical protein